MFGSEFAFGTKSEHDVAVVGLWGVPVYFQGVLYICTMHLFNGGFAKVLWG